MYVAGEEISFSCNLIMPGSYANSILFVDICGEGYLISAQLLKPLYGNWQGQITLPDTLQTGVYLLRAYVGNPNGEPVISAKPLCVFNRFMNNQTNNLQKEKTGYIPIDMRGYPKPVNSDGLEIKANKTVVNTNQKIEFTLNNHLKETQGTISLSVFKANEQSTTIPEVQFTPFTASSLVRIYNYFVLAGKLTNAETGEVVPDETILLSIPDSIPNINYAYTNDNGEFRFVLDNLYGEQDIIIQTLNKKIECNINLYPVLLLPPKRIPYYILDDVEQSEFVQLAIKRATINQVFATAKADSIKQRQKKIPFYGTTHNRVYPYQFVPLVDFAEIAWEILPTVRYKNSKDSTYLTIWNPNNKGFFNTPWVLVDGIPVYDLSQINPLNSEKISWVDIQAETRCYGEILMKGLIDIQTKNGNYTDLELPVNSVRTTIETFYDPTLQPVQDEPVFNDVLYWNPHIGRKKGTIQIDVQTSNEKGSYVAVAQTCDPKGKIYRSVIKFNVE